MKTKLHKRPTSEGLWHPVDASGVVGWPVEVSIVRDDDGKRHFHLYHGLGLPLLAGVRRALVGEGDKDGAGRARDGGENDLVGGGECGGHRRHLLCVSVCQSASVAVRSSPPHHAVTVTAVAWRSRSVRSPLAAR